MRSTTIRAELTLLLALSCQPIRIAEWNACPPPSPLGDPVLGMDGPHGAMIVAASQKGVLYKIKNTCDAGWVPIASTDGGGPLWAALFGSDSGAVFAAGRGSLFDCVSLNTACTLTAIGAAEAFA